MRTNPRAAQALVPVLFVVLILTAFAAVVASTAHTEALAGMNALAETQSYFAARGAVNYAAAQIESTGKNGATAPTLTPPGTPDSGGWVKVDDLWYKVEVVDTASRLNVNTATMPDLVKLPVLQANPDIAAAIVDWRDADDNPTVTGYATGAESDYYQTLTPPYSAANAPFAALDQLLLVKGMTPQLLYIPAAGPNPAITGVTGNGSAATGGGGMTRQARPPTGGQNGAGQGGGGPTGGGAGGSGLGGGTALGGGPGAGNGQPNGGQGAGAQPGASSNSGAQPMPPVDTGQSRIPLWELLTTYSRELNVGPDGTARVNINTATETDLENRAGLPAATARLIVSNRGAGITSVADLMSKPYSITRTTMQQIADKITVTSGQYRNGVININAAPREVLATIPGIDADTLSAVIQARQGGTTFTGIGDLFQLSNLTAPQMKTLVDNVCTHSSVYLIRVKVRSARSRAVYAAEALVEIPPLPSQASGAGAPGAAGGSTPAQSSTPQSQSATPPAPIILQWREVARHPGWADWLDPSGATGQGGTVSGNVQ